MKFEEVCNILNAAIFAKEARTLTKVEKTILAGAWQDETYEDISENSQEYSVNYLKRDVGPKLWKLLSAALGQPINKKNLRAVLDREGSTEAISSKGRHRSISNPASRNKKSQLEKLVSLSKKSERSAAKSVQDWGEAVEISEFFGYEEELSELKHWSEQHCRTIALMGIGGVGKTALSIKLAKQIQDQYEFVIWRSLGSVPLPEELITELISVLSHGEATTAEGESNISQLMHYLHQHRCLLILDGVEAIFQPGRRAGRYSEGYEKYGELIIRIGEEKHQSCLILVSREKPGEIALMEGKALGVRSLKLNGLNLDAAQAIIRSKGLSTAEDNQRWRQLINHYSGNPLALKIASTAIYELFNGKVFDFLEQKKTLFESIYDLIEDQIDRLSPAEHTIINWLGINRSSILFNELQEDILSSEVKRKFLGVMKSLKNRSLIEVNEQGFTLQPMVREYLTEKLIEAVYQDIVRGLESTGAEANREIALQNYALLKAQVEDPIIEAQINTLVKPILDKLLAIYGNQDAVASQLKAILARIKNEPAFKTDYAAGNLINLLRELGIELDSYDFSNLALRQARLHHLNLRNANLSHSDLSQAVFSEAIGDVITVSFSKTGEFLVTGDIEGRIHVWRFSTSTGRFTKHLNWQGHNSWVRSVTISPDEQLLASSSNDYTVKVWDIHTGRCIRTQYSKDWMRSVQFNPANNQLLAIACDNYAVKLWDIASEEQPVALTGDSHMDRVRSLAFSTSGEWLASGSDDHAVILWSVSDRRCIEKLFDGHTAHVRAVAFSPDDQFLASGGDDGLVILWDVSRRRYIEKLKGHIGWVRSVAFSPNGQFLVSGSDDCTIKIWDLATKECIATLDENSGKHIRRIQSIAFSPDGQFLVSGNDNQTLKLWRLSDRACLKTIEGCTTGVQTLQFADQSTLVSGDDNHTIRVWTVQEGQEDWCSTLVAHTGRISSVAVNQAANGRQILASSSDDCTVKLWDLKTGQCLQTLENYTKWIRSVAFSPDGRMLAVAGDDQQISIRAIREDTVASYIAPKFLKGHSHWVRSIAFSADGQWLASGGDDQFVRLWKIGSKGKEWNELKLGKHHHRIRCLAFSPDNQILASSSDDSSIKLWRIPTGEQNPTGEPIAELLVAEPGQPGCPGGVKSIAFSPDGQVLASGSDDGVVRLWHVATGLLCEFSKAHHRGVLSVAFSPDGQTLASGSLNGEIKLWEVSSGRCCKTLPAAGPYANLDITGARGLTPAQKSTLQELGAIEHDAKPAGI